MMLDITPALRSPGAAIPFTHLEPLADTEVLGETVRFPDPAVVTGTFSMVDEALVIKGKLTVTARAECARCLSPLTYPVSVPLHESFLRVDPREEVEEDPWEERLVFSGHRVDLSQLVMSLVVLDLPLRFVCETECRLPGPSGEEPPEEEETLSEHPFGALRQLFTKNQEE